MRKYLTIGELADLMKTSTSKIRFYEKEGLLAPCKIDDNGYRLYDFNEIDRLDTILLLRKMDISLKDMKAIFNSNSVDSYLEALKSSITSIDSRIEQLINKKQYIVKKINYIQNFMTDSSSFNVTLFAERILNCLHTGNILKYSLKDIYDVLKSKGIDYSDTYQDNYIIPLNNDNYSFCLMNTPGIKNADSFDRIILPEGMYLNYEGFVQGYDVIDNEIVKLYDHMKKNDLYPIGNLVIIERIRSSDYYFGKINISIQIPIEDNKK
ncbi:MULTISPECIES: helix-turn-helix domain-containing protein [Alkaliphilus]|uniref:helix-turn-helix domain-containing protein n=1 Tax=Alkaliphilus TaxID=114627 RepID=UPI001865866B|nr:MULTISPECIES: MerR family transcriptional regulator [Alkaliphilus]